MPSTVVIHSTSRQSSRPSGFRCHLPSTKNRRAPLITRTRFRLVPGVFEVETKNQRNSGDGSPGEIGLVERETGWTLALWCSAWPFQLTRLASTLVSSSIHSAVSLSAVQSVCLHVCNIPHHSTTTTSPSTITPPCWTHARYTTATFFILFSHLPSSLV